MAERGGGSHSADTPDTTTKRRTPQAVSLILMALPSPLGWCPIWSGHVRAAGRADSSPAGAILTTARACAIACVDIRLVLASVRAGQAIIRAPSDHVEHLMCPTITASD